MLITVAEIGTVSREPRGQQIQPEIREGFLRVMIRELGLEGLDSSLHGKLEAFQTEGMMWVKAWRLELCECGDVAGAEDEVPVAGCRQLRRGQQKTDQESFGHRAGGRMGA